jgi:hypothetical protein
MFEITVSYKSKLQDSYQVMGICHEYFSLDLLVETLPSKITQKNYKCILKLFLESIR